MSEQAIQGKVVRIFFCGEIGKDPPSPPIKCGGPILITRDIDKIIPVADTRLSVFIRWDRDLKVAMITHPGLLEMSDGALIREDLDTHVDLHLFMEPVKKP